MLLCPQNSSAILQPNFNNFGVYSSNRFHKLQWMGDCFMCIITRNHTLDFCRISTRQTTRLPRLIKLDERKERWLTSITYKLQKAVFWRSVDATKCPYLWYYWLFFFALRLVIRVSALFLLRLVFGKESLPSSVSSYHANICTTELATFEKLQ